MTEPVLRVVRGEPTAEELAVLVTVLASRSTTAATPAPATSRWADPARRVRDPLRHGQGAWRWAGR